MNGPRLLCFATLLSVTMALSSCAGAFDKCVKPVASEVTWTGTATELGDVVGAFLLCDPTFDGSEAPACALRSLDDLAAALGPDGRQIVDCLIGYFETSGTAKQKAAAKAVGAKRGIHGAASLFCPGDLLRAGPSAGRQAHNLDSRVQLTGPQLSRNLQKPSGEEAAAHATAPMIRVRQASSPLTAGRGPGVASAVPALPVDALGDSASPAKVTFAYAGETAAAR